MQQNIQDEEELELTAQVSGRSAAGRKGGLATKARKGSEFYREIGRRGGQSRGSKRD